MTSHVRHRRTDIATDPPPAPLEPGELAVNTANRQIAAGSPGGQPIALIAVRYFDERAQYVENDFVVHDGNLWSARADVPPGPFTAEQWRKASSDEQDPTDLTAYLLKTGGTMSGPLILYGEPAEDREAATKKYVDDSTPPPPQASLIPFTPVGGLEAVDVQAALAELDTEKVAKAGDTMTGHLVLSGGPVDDLHPATKLYTDTQISQGLALKVDRAGDTMNGALVVRGNVTAGRTPNTGTLFLGTDGLHYLDFNGTKYTLPAGGLDVGGVVNNSGANINGTLNVNEASNFAQNKSHTIYTNQYFGAGPPANFLIYGGPYPTIAFLSPNYFGANFGMNTDGNFYMGGWSHGAGVYYKFITTRDGAPVTAARRLHYTDYWHYTGTGYTEPGGAFSHMCAMTGNTTPDGWNYGNMVRYRYEQVLINGSWYTVDAAS